MKRMLFGFFVAAVLSVPATAADMALKAAPMKAPPPAAAYDWTGFYMAFRAAATPSARTGSRQPLRSISPADAIAAGLTADIRQIAGCSAARPVSITRSRNGCLAWRRKRAGPTFGAPTPIRISFCSSIAPGTDGLGTLTGRVGYAFDRVLIYGKGGGAWAHDRFAASTGGVDIQAVTDDRFGWTAGAGVEWAFANNWSVKVEYDHLDFDSQRETLQPLLAGGAAFQYDIRQRVDLVKAGVNYKFGGPVVARY